MATTTTANGDSKKMLVQLTTDGVPKLHCPVCNKALISLNGYVKHVKKHDPPGGFMCRYCDARFCSEDDVKRHLNEEHTTIVCRICKQLTFSSEMEYREHIRSVHNGIDRELYKCNKCDAEYKTHDPFRRHIDTNCGSIKPFKCDECEMTFVTKYNLKQHKESHTGNSKFCCSYCGKNFLQKGRLVEHERSHTGEKPYQCDVCGKSFAHRESIVTHSSIHTGIRLVECRCCESRFSCHSNLIKHRRARPETCGQPIYDPPKNRKRINRSRIPATLNPTSEIRVSSQNKIIKPNDREKQKKSFSCKKDKVFQGNTCETKNKRQRKLKKYNEKSGSGTEIYEMEFVGHNNTKIADIIEKDNSNSKNVNYIDEKTPAQQAPCDISNESETFNEFRVNSAEELCDSNSMEFLSIKLTSTAKSTSNRTISPLHPIKEEHLEIELQCDEQENELLTNSYNTAFSKFEGVKPERGEPNDFGIDNFNERDVLIRELLNTDDDDTAFGVAILDRMDRTKNHTNAAICSFKTNKHVKLEKTEIILVDDCNVANFDGVEAEEENGLEFFESPKDCRIMLDDITKRFPQLKEQSSLKLDSINFQTQKTQLLDAKFDLTVNNCEDKKRSSNRNKQQLYNCSKDSNEVLKNSIRNTGRRRLTKQLLKARIKLLQKEQSTWQCPHCVRVYHMRKPFEKHLRDHHQLNEEEVKKLCTTDLDMAMESEEIFKCHICDKIYMMRKRLQDHIQRHGPNGNLVVKCPCYCSLYFATKEEAIVHAKKQHRDKIYCEICDKYCNGHDSLKNHIKHLHSKKESTRTTTQRNFICDKCGKKFPGRTTLTDHVRSDCGRKPLYQCHVCSKHFTTAGILKTHMLLHSDNAPFQCDKCGKRFKVKSQYSTHIKTRHSDIKPFKCHLCPKAYPYRESLLTHMTVHTGIKRFLCNGCGKRFTCISNLQAHRKVHAETCGLLPLNTKATQYMGVQKGYLLLGAKPEAGVDYKETNTLIAKEIIDRDVPIAAAINFPSAIHTERLATVPLPYPIDTLQPQLDYNKTKINVATEPVTITSNINDMLHIPQNLSDLIEDDPNNFN